MNITWHIHKFQKCSGKTFTMMGCRPHDPREVVENAGLYVLAAREIFTKLNRLKNGHSHGGSRNAVTSIHGAQPGNNQLCLFVSCFEIYGGKLFDLLNEHNTVKCLEDAKQHVQLVGKDEREIEREYDVI